ncbi:MAG: ABC transporter permease [Bacteroidota bacterium]
MNNIITTISEFIRDLREQKLRTAMTVFGIIWGTVAIIVLLAFGAGFKKQLSQDFHGIGESIAIMFPGRTTKPYQGFGIGRPVNFIEDDAKLLGTQVSGIATICPEYSSGESQIHLGTNILNTTVGGVYPVYSEMRNVIPAPGGRFINDLDMQERKRVVLIGDAVKDNLFGDGQAVGKVIYIGQTPFTVIGVMVKKTQNSSYNRRDKDRVFIPASTYASVFGAVHVRNIIYIPKDPTKSEEVNSQVRQVLSKKYKFDPDDKDAVWIWDTTEQDKFLFYFFLGFNIFMGMIGSFTLAVGGIGVANIMYIVVQERIREIGVKRAVGANRRNILFQFFMETFFIIFIGSAIGFGLAYGIIQLLQYIPIKEFVGTPVLSWQVALITMVILSLVGIAAGFMPARRASNLNVVDCLRS